MSNDRSGFIRLQTQSHIAATQWQQWTEALDLEPVAVEDIWDEIGYPVLTATRQLPPIPFILQLRAERRHVDLFEFKDEIAPLLAFLNLFAQLGDDTLGGKAIPVLFGFFRLKVASRVGDHRADQRIEEFAIDLCKLILVARIIDKETITLTAVLTLVTRKQTPVAQVVDLGIQALGSHPYARLFHRCLTGPPSAEEMAQWDAEDDEEENEESDEEKVVPRRSPYPLDRFINDFRTALEALYTAQAGSAETEETNNPRELLAARVAALKAFDPLRATIPSPDEAEEIADQRRRNIDPNRVIKRSPASRSAPSGDKRSSRPSFASGDGGGALASATVGSGDAVEGSEVGTQKRDKSKSIDDVLADPATEAEASGGGAPTAGEAAAAAATTPDIDLEVRAAAAQAAANGEDVETEEDAPPAPTEEEIVALAPVSPADFSQKIRQLGQLIATVERGDDAMWQIFLDPERGIEERRALATALAAAESPANQAYRLIRASAQFIGLKKLLHLGEVPQRNRRFTTLVSGFVNFAQTTHRTISSNDDQLVGLEPVLDHAAGTLIRLENLRINQFYAQQQPDHYNAEAVTAFRDEALAAVQALVDGKRLELVLTMAEEDTAAMIDLFSAESYVRELVANCRSYAEELQKGGHLASLEKLETAIGEAPIEFDRAEPAEPDPGPLPVQWTIGDELGPIFQRACNYLCEKAWAVLCERHEPKKVLPKLVDAARAAMSSCFVLQPERRRHAARPRMPITVASLAKLSGNANVHQLYVRVGTDARCSTSRATRTAPTPT